MALTPTLVGNTCYPSLTEAADAYFSAIPVATSVTGLTSYQFEYFKNAAVWYMQKLTIANNGNITVNFVLPALPPTFPDCDLTAPYLDGIAIGWGVAGAMFAALSVIFISKAFFK